MNAFHVLANTLLRIAAVFVASALTVLGAASILPDISTKSAALLAGILGVANVVENLARAFIADGKLNASDINRAFAHPKQENTKK